MQRSVKKLFSILVILVEKREGERAEVWHLGGGWFYLARTVVTSKGLLISTALAYETDFALSCSQWEQQPLFGARFAAIWCGSQYARLPQKYSNFRRHWTRTRRLRQGNAQGEGHQPRHQGKKMVRLLIIIIHSHESLNIYPNHLPSVQSSSTDILLLILSPSVISSY